MSKRKQKSKSGSRRPAQKQKSISWRSITLAAGGLLIVAVFIAWMSGLFSAGGGSGATILPVGPTTLCQQLPRFVDKVGLGQRVFIDTTQQEFTGLALQDAETGQIYQDSTWDDAGNVGPHVVDSNGNIYVVPVPQVSLFVNPPEKQNKIYQIDTNSGIMAEYIDLPWAQPPSGANPFGAVGLAFDCNTNSIYVATLAGSTPAEELGRIYRIDVNSGEIVDQLDNIDALGLGVFNGASGKRIYYGSARTPEVYSIPLDANGDFSGEPRFEFSLAALEGGSYDNAHRLRFTRDNQLEVKGIGFGYRLMAASDPLRNVYLFNYNQQNDDWDLVEVAVQ